MDKIIHFLNNKANHKSRAHNQLHKGKNKRIPIRRPPRSSEWTDIKIGSDTNISVARIEKDIMDKMPATGKTFLNNGVLDVVLKKVE